jgi:hypothetical protein
MVVAQIKNQNPTRETEELTGELQIGTSVATARPSTVSCMGDKTLGSKKSQIGAQTEIRQRETRDLPTREQESVKNPVRAGCRKSQAAKVCQRQMKTSTRRLTKWAHRPDSGWKKLRHGKSK